MKTADIPSSFHSFHSLVKTTQVFQIQPCQAWVHFILVKKGTVTLPLAIYSITVFDFSFLPS